MRHDRRPETRIPALVLALLALLIPAGCTRPTETSTGDSAAGRPRFDYEAPEPGTYRLPAIQPAADGDVLMAGTGEHRKLFELMGDRYVVLSFVYTHCTATAGCPFAMATLHQLRQGLEEDPELEEQVRLITLSFDPARDTVDTMARYAENAGIEDRDEPWVFLTTSGPRTLQPILDGYGQYVVRETDERGEYTGQLSHVLKVFLVDRDRRVRNIYSSDFLHPELVLADLRTLALEDRRPAREPRS